MIDHIYLCGDCLWPVSFPWGQKMHIGTGWYCWKEHHSDEEPVDAFWPFKPPGDLEMIDEIVDGLVDLYDRWKARDKDHRVFTVTRRYLRKGRTDVVHEFLKRTYRDENIGPFLRQLTSTTNGPSCVANAALYDAKGAGRGRAVRSTRRPFA